MENTISNGKMNDRKVRALNENVSPLKIELDDKRVRYFQSTTATPGLPQPYGENDGSPARYFFAGSPVSRKAGEAFTSPTFGASKYRSAKTYSGTSSGNSSFSSRGRLSLSPLSSIENLEMSSHMSSPMYGTPVKVDEEVLVMDDIQVRHMSGGKSGRSSSSSSGRSSSSSKSTFKTEICRSWEESGNCRYNSKCQFAHGREELLLNRLTMKSKSEAQTGKLSTRPGPYIYSPNSRNIAAAESELAVTISQPASPESELAVTISQPASPESLHTLANFNTTSDWSPLDDGIEVVLPNGSDKAPSREEVDAYISHIQYGPTTKRRLPVFAALT